MGILRPNKWSPEYVITHQGECAVMLGDKDVLEEIPSLNIEPLHNLKNNQIVKYCGMVQDILDPEYYFQKYEVENPETQTRDIRNGMYADAAHCLLPERILLESKNNVSAERQTYIVISTPGLNDWAKETKTMTNLNMNVNGGSSGKRSIDESECENMDCAEPTQKKEKTTSNENSENSNRCNIISKEHYLNFPFPINDGKSCIVKIYNESSFQVNQILEIIGFVSFDSLSSEYDESESMNEMELRTRNPPGSLIPRLHAIKINESTREVINKNPQIISKAELIKKDLHLVLSNLLFGDRLAADYTILHLLSSIHSRNDYHCLGAFPVNLSHIPKQYDKFSQQFYEFLKLLMRKSYFLELNIEALNDLSFIPTKDYECNRLTSGILQLSNNTHLVIDETKFNCGHLSAIGIRNYNALDDLIKFQKVAYNFKFYDINFQTNIPVFILSECKSFIPCSNQVALSIDASSHETYSQAIQDAKTYLDDEIRLENIRQYLQIMKQTTLEFSNDISNVVQEDFVRMRQKDETINADSLHNFLELARLICLSEGKTVLEIEYWQRALEMDMERTKRLPKRGVVTA